MAASTAGGPEYLDFKTQNRPFTLAFSSTSADVSSNRPPSSRGSSRDNYGNGSSSSLSPFPSDLKLCYGSYIEHIAGNTVSVIGLNPQLVQDPEGFLSDNQQEEADDFVVLAKQSTPYPVTKVDFSPASLASKLQGGSGMGHDTREMIASTSDCLRLYDLTVAAEDQHSGYVGQVAQPGGHRLVERSVLSNAKTEHSAPLTSFCWSTVDPSSIVTSSIDTTCTIWDISTNQAVTQLISHDREVFDVAWSPGSKDVFASVGADGSVRSFDLRHLDHSTILFESSSTTSPGRARGAPLLRMAFNPNDPNTLAVIHADCPNITILDVRSPGIAVAELQGHHNAVNGIAWHAGSQHNGEYENATLASVSDDCQVLLWDLMHPNASSASSASASGNGSSKQQTTLPRPVDLPNAAYTAPSEVNAVAWGGGRDYLAVAFGNGTIRCLRM